MRIKRCWGALLLAAAVAVAPATALGQDSLGTEPQIPLPLNPRLENGGFYFAGEFLFMKQTRDVDHQLLAVRGFFDSDGSITGTPGSFVGSHTPALYADSLGQETYQPGFSLTLGWRFRNGAAVEFSWWHLWDAKYSGGASIEPKGFNVGANLADSFISSFVFNFPSEFAGPDSKTGLGSPGATFGIWNAAAVMQVFFTQRFDQYDISGRFPLFETETNRTYGLIGPRFAWIWERFRWRTVSENAAGGTDSTDVAIYNNIVSNRMYGAHVGLGFDQDLGATPVGTFAVSLDLQAAVMVDIVKERANYERADRAIGSKHSRTVYTVVPELQGQANLWWYPISGVQLRFGYDVMTFFNTIAAENPVSFDYLNINPEWNHKFIRLFNGFNAGIGFTF